ncbi:MAG: TM1266 family iron-only hydrogenase system putative regulator [Eubacteriaceae bacterium]
MKRIAVISIILENPTLNQDKVNNIIADFKGIIKGRMGLPLQEEGLSVIAVTVLGELNDINTLTGRLGKVTDTHVKCSISKKELI